MTRPHQGYPLALLLLQQSQGGLLLLVLLRFEMTEFGEKLIHTNLLLLGDDGHHRHPKVREVESLGGRELEGVLAEDHVGVVRGEVVLGQDLGVAQQPDEGGVVHQHPVAHAILGEQSVHLCRETSKKRERQRVIQETAV